MAALIWLMLKASLDVGIGSIGLCGEDYRALAQDVLPGSLFTSQIQPQQVDSGSDYGAVGI